MNQKNIGYLLIGFAVALLLLLTLVKIDVDKQATYLCSVFHQNEWDMTECPAHQSNTSWMLLAAFGISFFLLGLGVYSSFFFQPTTKQENFKLVNLSTLDDEEKKIYGLIQAKGGSAFQGDLVRETGFSKVKITRILDKLELNGVLERKRRGMTNIIVLK
ncbi:hypothetical protein HYX14_03025 [Candidatus Woesearchaeota archaeon]|nr:hypothetical protein [Candidatus Woesearchaeota archaeon]